MKQLYIKNFLKNVLQINYNFLHKKINDYNSIIIYPILLLNLFFFIYTSIVFVQFKISEIFISLLVFFFIFLLTTIIYQPSFLKFKFKLNFTQIFLVLLTFLFIIFYFNISPYWASAYPTYPLAALDFDLPYRGDAFYHTSVIHSIINHGYPSTGQHDVPFTYYHVLSHYIESIVFKISKIDVLDSYGLFFYFKYIFVISSILVFLSESLKGKSIISYLISLIFFTNIIFYNSTIIGSHSLWFPTALFFLSFNKIKNIIFSKEKISLINYLFIILTTLLIIFGKISLGLMYATFLAVNILFRQYKDFRIYLFAALLIIPLFLYFRNFFGFDVFSSINLQSFSANFFNYFQYIFFNNEPEVRRAVYVCVILTLLFILTSFCFRDKSIQYNVISILISFSVYIVICLFLRHIGFDQSHIYYMSLGFGTVASSYLYSIFLEQIYNSKIKISINYQITLKYLSYLINFLFNKLSIAILFFIYSFKYKKKIQMYLIWIAISLSAFYSPFQPSISDFNYEYIIGKIRFYKNIPFSNVVDKSIIFKNDSVIRYSTNQIEIDYYGSPINIILPEKNKLDFFKMLSLNKDERSNLLSHYNRPFFEFRESVKKYIISNNLDNKKVLIFFPKEILEKKIYPLDQFSKYTDRIHASGIALYSVTGIPLINGVKESHMLYGFKQYKKDSYTLSRNNVNLSSLCKFKKDIISVEDFNPTFLKLHKC